MGATSETCPNLKYNETCSRPCSPPLATTPPLAAAPKSLYTELMPGFFVENFGCRAARADGEAVSAQLRAGGLLERSLDEADVIIVNTCSVTAEADRAARAFIRRSHRHNPSAHIVVTGCYAQRAPDELASLDGVRAVVGNSHKALAPAVAAQLVDVALFHARPASALIPVASLMGNRSGNVAIFADDRFAHSFIEEAQVTHSPASSLPTASSASQARTQTRPNLKIQEGCNNRCTFCVIPHTRGSSRSLPPDAVLRQVEGFIAAGGKELVLSGINLGQWGRDRSDAHDAPPSLAALVLKILTNTSLARLRLSSIEPMDWTDELMALLGEFGRDQSSPRFARHAHLPLQSGSDAVLRRMHRRYRPWHYQLKVDALIHAAGPDLTLGADVMVGFPGETDAEFDETCAMIRALPFGYLHLFPFSPRPATRAWALHMETPVPRELVDERMAALRILAELKTLQHRQRFVGRSVHVITLDTPDTQHGTAAITDNFLPVRLSSRLARNQLIRAHVNAIAEGATDDGTNEGIQEGTLLASITHTPSETPPL